MESLGSEVQFRLTSTFMEIIESWGRCAAIREVVPMYHLCLQWGIVMHNLAQMGSP